jgi:TonB family protein
MFDQPDKPKFDPRSPVQPARSSAPYFIAALIAAVVIWTVQQYSASDSIRRTSKVAPRDKDAAERSASARGEVGTLFTTDDYPAIALANNQEGTAQARLIVDADGHVSKCTIIRSAGYESLDSATCSILEKRAHFSPARDATGKPIESTVVTPPIRWQLEG